MDSAEVIAAHDPGTQALLFMKNQKMLDVVNGEEIGFLEKPYQTKASESLCCEIVYCVTLVCIFV